MIKIQGVQQYGNSVAALSSRNSGQLSITGISKLHLAMEKKKVFSRSFPISRSGNKIAHDVKQHAGVSQHTAQKKMD